jgi:hypothetical protein
MPFLVDGEWARVMVADYVTGTQGSRNLTTQLFLSRRKPNTIEHRNIKRMKKEWPPAPDQKAVGWNPYFFTS